MATKSQRKQQKAKRRERKRRRENKLRQSSPSQRLTKRLSRQKPKAWAGELTEDVAIFDDQVFATLAPESQDYVRLIREELTRLCERSGGNPSESLNGIPRRSLYSQWRLFLRGLAEWIDGEPDSANESWKRLDPDRRPARIAASLLLAYRDDLAERDEKSAKEAEGIVAGDLDVTMDDTLIYNGKLVRRLQIDRLGIKVAHEITRIPNEVEDATVSPAHIDWLRDFTTEFRTLEPNLVQALHECAIGRASDGVYIDMFRLTVKYFRGPKHDRKNNLKRFLIETEASGEQIAARYLDAYLDQDLPRNTDLTPQLRGAIASIVHTLLAARELDPGDPMFSLFSAGIDFDAVEKHFENAVKAYPKNRLAWKGYESVYFRRLQDSRGLNKSTRERLLMELANVHERWAAALPDDIHPRLELVDYLLENDRTDAAKEQVDWLAGTKRDSPLADAMIWRWNLLEAMRLCRRKSWLSDAPKHLDHASERWPAWLADHWLAYLRAGIELRRGDSSAMDEVSANTAIDPLTDACMKLGAAQRMRVPSKDLKPLRQAFDQVIASHDGMKFDNLLNVASFFWDLNRARLKCPALRAPSKTLLNRLKDTLEKNPKIDTGKSQDPRIRAALLGMAVEGWFNDGYQANVPPWLSEVRHIPMVAAVIATAASQCKVDWGINKHVDTVRTLRQAANGEDAFYRHYYNQLADEISERANQQPFWESSYGEDDSDEEELCQCATCRAERGEID
ncbi:hypothetical protein [Roseiconus lacunae]|uniref:hypothetical protein n=1 Tax=Roseiconus lacunae TaxID=2605694 RepID=UPI001E528427|nr:hypothetical protein [Roseiconus lacunae]MCD0462475.1 hypothetical protein [Roseiconus lacunae]